MAIPEPLDKILYKVSSTTMFHCPFIKDTFNLISQFSLNFDGDWWWLYSATCLVRLEFRYMKNWMSSTHAFR